jgi:release factor glutamine methyltransferase
LTDLVHILKDAESRLTKTSDTPRLDAQVLLAYVFKKPRSWILAHPEFEPSPIEIETLETAIHRVESGDPLPYVLGRQEFFGLDFLVTPATLIPRPETELLVEYALAWLDRAGGRRLAVDIGTGSGCIAIALAYHRTYLNIVASDISIDALRVAHRNAIMHGVSGRVSFLQADLLPTVSVPFDLVCANLPYIPSAVLRDLTVYGKEPNGSLDGGVDGLKFIRQLLTHSAPQIEQGGLILIEIEASQGEATTVLARRSFPGAEVKLLQDIAGLDRLVAIHLQ